MLERKLYKTKLCILYQRGHCPRQSCSFAHGNAELRGFSGSFSGRREYRGTDLREKLERRHSPHHRYSPGRNSRGRHAYHGYSPSRSPARKSERRPRKKQCLDGQSDLSGSLKNSDGVDNQTKGKGSSYDDKDVLKQLKEAQADVDMLEDHKCQLEIALEEKTPEVDTLASKIQELESQLSKEEEECRRITSKIRKFIKAHNRSTQAQEELKRTQTRLQRFGDQLASDISRLGENDEDPNINILSDGETSGDDQINPRIEHTTQISPYKKRFQVDLGVSEEVKHVTSRKREGFSVKSTRFEKLARLGGTLHSENNGEDTDMPSKIPTRDNYHKPLAFETKCKQGKNDSSSIFSVDKVKGSESGRLLLPLTSMAAHAADDLTESLYQEEKFEVRNASASENGRMNEKSGLPLPPPLPIIQNAYNQYDGENEDVDVEDLGVGVGVRETDINSEVEIEQL